MKKALALLLVLTACGSTPDPRPSRHPAASSRPENSQLLQSSARWLRSDTIGDTTVDVFEGPRQKDAQDSRLRYWLDAAGPGHPPIG